MATKEWGDCEQGLAACLAALTSAKMSNHGASGEAKLSAQRLPAGRALYKPALRAAESNKIANIVQSSLRLQAAGDLVTKIRAKLREVWRAPPCLTARDPHPWWDLIASSGLSISTTELEWKRAMQGLG